MRRTLGVGTGRWAGAILATVACCCHAQELLVNGDFSTGTLAGWTFTPDAAAEPSLLGTVVSYQGSNAFRANTGNNGTGVDAGGTLSQLVPLVAGASYQVSAGKLAMSIQNASPNADGGRITVSLAGTVLHTFEPADPLPAVPADTLDSFSMPFLAAATGPAAFEVRFVRRFPNFTPNAIHHFADDLSVEFLIPEPSGVALLSLTGVGLTAMRRRYGARREHSRA
jgi:hypothetical protein